MDQGTGLALRAIVRGLEQSGAIGTHALTVIVDELRYAARDARDMLFDHEGTEIERLAESLHRGLDGNPEPGPAGDHAIAASSLRGVSLSYRRRPV